MLLESIVRKTLEINRHVIKKVEEVSGEIVLNLDVLPLTGSGLNRLSENYIKIY